MEFPFASTGRIVKEGDTVRMTQAWVDSLRNLQPVWGFETERPMCKVIEVGEYFTLLEGLGIDAGITAWIPTNKLSVFIE